MVFDGGELHLEDARERRDEARKLVAPLKLWPIARCLRRHRQLHTG